uniref:Protein PsbN n=1 Tax=Cyanoptyche gloeocystis TaxID=77922 RepID=A0A3G1IWI6_9EUKA|nr:photosystem II protein N [Cyanoptyche gloeocystis]
MELATFIGIFIASVLIAFTVLAVYKSFGPPSKNLRDPFEEHED